MENSNSTAKTFADFELGTLLKNYCPISRTDLKYTVISKTDSSVFLFSMSVGIVFEMENNFPTDGWFVWDAIADAECKTVKMTINDLAKTAQK